MVSTIHDHTDPPNSQTLYLSVIADVTGYPETDADDPGILPADAQVRLQHTGSSPTIRCYKEPAGPGSDDWRFQQESAYCSFYFALKEAMIPSSRARRNSARAPSIPQPDYKSVGFGKQISCRDLDKIALTVPSGNPVLFAIFRAPIPACWFSERTVQTVSSARGGLPSLLPLARATLSPAIVRSDIRALSCLASVANIEIITSLNGPVESSHCS